MLHSRIPPSSASVWGKPGGCTGWVEMNQHFPEVNSEDDEEAREGTAAHEIAEALTQIGVYSGETVTPAIRDDFVGNVASNGVVWDDVMFDAAWLYADDVVRVVKAIPEEGRFFGAEHKVQAPMIHEESFGTTDNFAYNAVSEILYIWDFKYGHRYVDAFENWQGINYAAGLVEELGITALHARVVITIIQPRSYSGDGPIRRWEVPVTDLRPFWNILANNAHEALSGKGKCVPGHHCRDCNARHACTPFLRSAFSQYEMVGKPVPDELSAEALAVQLHFVQKAKAYMEYLEAGYLQQADSLIRAGTLLPGWELSPKIGNAVWNVPAEEVFALGDMLELNLQKAPEPVTPAQARKLGVDDELVKAYSVRPSTGVKLTPISESAIKKIFSKEKR